MIPLTAKDVREIYSLRHALENFAVDLGAPVEEPSRLEPMRRALAEMRRAARRKDLSALSMSNLAFHRALAGLPGHERLMRAYDSIGAQLQMCMALNLRFRQSVFPDPDDAVKRHELLLQLIESGDRAALKKAIAGHGDRSFLTRLDELIDADGISTPESTARARRSSLNLVSDPTKASMRRTKRRVTSSEVSPAKVKPTPRPAPEGGPFPHRTSAPGAGAGPADRRPRPMHRHS